MIEAMLLILLAPFALLAATFTIGLSIGIVKYLWQVIRKKK